MFGFTGDKTGANLPAELRPWTQSSSRGVIETRPSTMKGWEFGSSDPVVAAVERDGFYVARSETLSRRAGIPWVN